MSAAERSVANCPRRAVESSWKLDSQCGRFSDRCCVKNFFPCTFLSFIPSLAPFLHFDSLLTLFLCFCPFFRFFPLAFLFSLRLSVPLSACLLALALTMIFMLPLLPTLSSFSLCLFCHVLLVLFIFLFFHYLLIYFLTFFFLCLSHAFVYSSFFLHLLCLFCLVFFSLLLVSFCFLFIYFVFSFFVSFCLFLCFILDLRHSFTFIYFILFFLQQFCLSVFPFKFLPAVSHVISFVSDFVPFFLAVNNLSFFIRFFFPYPAA